MDSTKYFDEYAGGQEYNRSFKDYFCEEWTCDLIEAVWGRRPPYKLLDCGSANGLTLEAFAKINVDAWGVENNEYIHSQTPRKWRSRNLMGDVRRLQFPDGSFDFVYETCLCYLPEEFDRRCHSRAVSNLPHRRGLWKHRNRHDH